VVADESLLDFEAATSHDVTVRVTDQGGLTLDKVLTINLDNVSGDYTGSSGDDVIVGSSEENTIDGLDGNDQLIGGPSDDTIYGGDGDDIISGGPGNDVLYGGMAGVDKLGDTLDYSSAMSGISIDLSNTAPQATGGAGTDAVSGFEVLIGSDHNDFLTGSSVSETILGGNGDDLIEGNGGSDLIDGAAGDDTLYADGGDTILGGDASDKVYAGTAALAAPVIWIDGGAGIDSLFLTGSGGPALNLQLDLVGKVTNIESIDATAPGAVIDLRDLTGDGLRAILGLPAMGGSGTLTVAIDGNDFDVTAAAGQFTSFDAGTHTTTFFTDSGMTTEMAKVQVV
jgi:Ca2+-binding RTX toxin-like protein